MHTLCTPTDLIEVRRADNRGRGARGVFAAKAIGKDVIFERTPVLLIPKDHVFGDTPEAKRNSRISWYVFDWSPHTKRDYVALCLGYGSIYNHSYTPNANYSADPPDIMEFVALRDIEPGEEIFINYNGSPDDQTPVEFEVKNQKRS